MTAADIARALPGSTRNGNGWLCRCPVPDHGRGRGDRSPSLSVCDAAAAARGYGDWNDVSKALQEE